MRDFHSGPFTSLKNTDEFDTLLKQNRFLIFKHSPLCGTSAFAYEEVARFAEEQEQVPVYIVDVIGQRSLSQHIASRLGVTHQSPQLIVVDHGKAVWVKSHYGISYASIADHVPAAIPSDR